MFYYQKDVFIKKERINALYAIPIDAQMFEQDYAKKIMMQKINYIINAEKQMRKELPVKNIQKEQLSMTLDFVF